MSGGALGGKILGGGGGGGRELRSISLSDCEDGAGSCVCGEEDTAGEVDGTRETEVGPAGDLTPGEAAGEGWGAGAGEPPPGKRGSKGAEGGGTLLEVAAGPAERGAKEEGFDLTRAAGGWGVNLGTGGMTLGLEACGVAGFGGLGGGAERVDTEGRAPGMVVLGPYRLRLKDWLP